MHTTSTFWIGGGGVLRLEADEEHEFRWSPMPLTR
jgi:hypothetical protein